MLDRSKTSACGMDRIGLICLGLLLLSPMVFKVRIAGDAVVHPFTPLLLVAWCWTLWAAVDAGQREHGSFEVKWNIVTPPVLLIGFVIGGLGCSLAINSLRSGSWQPGGWLLVIKGFLYLAPLAFTALLVIRSGLQVLRLLNCMIPPVALLTLVYSFYRFALDPAASYLNARSESEPRYFVMGTFGEVLTKDGLVLRTDTVGQGAYGMYLVLVVVFSLALALVKGLDAGLPRWYIRGQAFLVCPAAVMGILYTGSRTTLVLLFGVLLLFALLLLMRGAGALTRTHVVRLVFILIIMSAVCWSARQYMPVSFPSLTRLEETLKSHFDLQRSALGTFSPLTTEPRPAVVRNVESRVWLWGKTVRYLAEHPAALLTGIGNDRRRFAEEVIGLSYEGDQVHFHTAHNLFLDVLVKGGLVTLAALLVSCLWFCRLAVTAVMTEGLHEQSRALLGIGFVLLAFWPPFVFVNLFGEEMFTDNLQLHWTMLFGVVIGLLSLATSTERSGTTGTIFTPSSGDNRT